MPKGKRTSDIEARREKERTRARRENGRRREKRKKTFKIFLYLILGLLLIAVLATLSFTVFFKISALEVSGETIYSDEQIIEASGIFEGQNMLALNTSEIEKRVTKSLPYIKRLDIKRRLPSKIELIAEAGEAFIGIKSENDFILADSAYKVLEHSDSCNCITVIGVVPENADPGEKLQLGAQTEKILTNVLNAISTEGLERISKIDLTSPVDIKLLYKEKYVLKLGNDDALAYKLKFCQKVAETESEEGVIDVSALDADNNKGYYRAKAIAEDIAE